MTTLATVDPIREDSDAWGASAEAGDALSRVPNGAPFLAIWVDPDKGVMWSKANTDFQSLSMMAAVLNEMAQICARQAMGIEDV